MATAEAEAATTTAAKSTTTTMAAKQPGKVIKSKQNAKTRDPGLYCVWGETRGSLWVVGGGGWQR